MGCNFVNKKEHRHRKKALERGHESEHVKVGMFQIEGACKSLNRYHRGEVESMEWLES